MSLPAFTILLRGPESRSNNVGFWLFPAQPLDRHGMAAERRENGRWRRALTEKGARISSVPRRKRWRDDGCIRDGKDADRRRQTRRWGSGCETTCAKWRREVYDNGESDSVTGSGSNHHQIPLRRYGGGYTATGHSLLFLLFTLYSLRGRASLPTRERRAARPDAQTSQADPSNLP